MLNPITFTVEGESGPVDITCSGLDYAAYEDTFDKPAIAGISEGRYKTWCYLVWHAMSRQGMTTDTFEEFLASTPQFGAPAKSEDVVPLESTAPTGE
jgi:hypothetical protein